MNSKPRRKRPVTIDRSGPVAMYHQLKQILLERIQGMRVGARLPSVRSMIGTYGVSLPVVRQALAELERDGVVEIRKGSGSFVKEVPRARGDAPRRIQFLFCGARANDPFFSGVLYGVEREASDEGYAVGYSRWEGSGAPPPAAGYVIGGMSATADVVLALVNRGRQFVLAGEMVGGGPTPPDVTSVEHDNRAGATLAVAHLVEAGHRRIAMVGGVGSNFWNERRRGYEEALRAADVEPDGRWFVPCDENSAVSAYAALKGAWRRLEKCTAIFAANDRLASGTYRVLSEKGRRVPGEVSVVGFDDLEFAKDLNPPLTTIRVDVEEMGRWTCRLLLRKLRDRAAKHVRMLLPLELVPRASCAPPRRPSG